MPSPQYQGLGKLLASLPDDAEISDIDLQPAETLMAYDVDKEGRAFGAPSPLATTTPGPWICVDLTSGEKYAIWKATGAVYQLASDGTVDDPLIELR